ncbi:hypothetical protein MMC30_003202 [Trapelia coarctata]|nr:hypothetical protein [Trapelia coarctata]
MESSSLGLPRTPDRAAFKGPSPPPRNSMEDADSSVTRKRPRLDSGDRAYRSMSADGALSTPPNAEPGKLLPHSNDEDQHSLSDESPGTASTHTLNGTPSKVTINVRDPNQTGSPPHPSAHDLPDQAVDSQRESSPPHSIINVSSSPPVITTVSSSPPCSPEIEVAELEDIDGHTGPTVWRASNGNMSAEELQTQLLDEFPLVNQYRNAYQAVGILVNHTQGGDFGDGHLIRELSVWIDNYLEHTKHVTSQWFNMFADTREFWDKIPVVVNELIRRSAKFEDSFIRPLEVDGEEDNRQFFEDLFSSYAALTARMMQIDCQTLLENVDDTVATPDLISGHYMRVFGLLFSSAREMPLWKLLYTAYSYSVAPILEAVVLRFTQQPSSGIQYLTQFIDLLLDRSQHQPQMGTDLWLPLNLANRATSYVPKDPTPSSSETSNFLADTSMLFKTIEAKIQAFITKQVSFLSLDLAKAFISELSAVLRHVIYADSAFVDAMTPEDFQFPHDATPEDRAMFVEFAWRFDLCKKCITQGRMEIRVQGVESMQEDLVNVYQRCIVHHGFKSLHMLPEYLSELILSSKLVDYIVGVESHPQLITRSKNIVGFLMVTGKYTNAQTDLIWQAVSLSQDSRTIDAVLELVSGIQGIVDDCTQLLYFYQKLIDLPLRYFDGRMLIHCKTLHGILVKKWNDKQGYGTKLAMPPYRLCLRLIREALADVSLPPQRKREIYQSAIEEIRMLMNNGPSESDTSAIYDECIADISGRTPSATGSMAALSVFLDHNSEDDIHHLANKLEFSAHIIDEFSSFTNSETTRSANPHEPNDALGIRLALLQKFIIHDPETISPDLSQRLWACMLGEQALGDGARDSAWAMLANAASKLACSGFYKRNSFLDRCINKQLPKLNPRFFTWGVLAFAEKVVQYESRCSDSETQEGKGSSLPGIELLWHLSLVVPHPTIGSKAIGMLVKAYLDASDAQRNRSSVIEGSHDAKLVERCIAQLQRAASRLKTLSDGLSSSEDDSMVIVPSEHDVSVEKLCFARSLLILKEFMQGMRSQLPDSPASLSKSQSPYSVSGETISIQVQIYNGGSSTGIKKVDMGDLSTFGEFMTRLIKLTGFSKLTVIVGGGRVDQTSWKESSLRDLKLDQKGLIIVQKAPGAESVCEPVPATSLRPLEAEVMKHFHELYDLLGMEEQLARDVYEFLGTFPPHKDITALVSDESTPIAISFPPDAPFKTLYSVYALKSYLSQQLQDGTIGHPSIRHGVRSTVEALLAYRLSGASGINRTEVTTAISLIECLMKFLKEPVPLAVSATYFDSASALFDRLRELINATQASPEIFQSAYLVQICFGVMLEASLYSQPVWDHYKSHPSTQLLIRSLLLDSSDTELREGVVLLVRSICGSLPSETAIDTHEFVSFFWESFLSLIPEATGLHKETEEFFSIALEVFRCVDEEAQEQLPLASYVQGWSKLLLGHRHDEFVGRDSIDWIVHGITGLLHWCIQLMRSKKRPLDIDTNLVEKIFRTHLFPEMSDTGHSTAVKPRVPILDSSTRGRLYSVLLALSTEAVGYRKLLGLVKDLLPQGEDSDECEWRDDAQTIEDYHYGSNWNFERVKSIRSPTGYPGIRNLSNTCYLNSLFTQLFMNVSFRAFMLNRNIADELSQKLLSETQKLFANMQESWVKCVEPQGITESLVTYDGTVIDVAIQMDVDEFYNLLFDRWESQIPSAADKKTFRQFYGGQIVQQIKSKECPHISERLEPFSAIQCEISGKATLAESLNAYVEGEVMEGDNKYSCSSCGSYVNAVKRACLKDVPDNLIFHLKRFDYDLCTSTRNKINDLFEFPEEIDMAPYNVEYLKDPDQPIEADNFTLVGVLVHSGNAESGHYYSYVRERPSESGDGGVWVEFNDADVTRFDPSNIPDQCFGGLSDPMPYSTMRFHKTWNAYMLFYQRTSSMKVEQERHLPITPGIPVKEAIPMELGNRIAVENELFIRRYCFFDPEHAKFIKSLLDQHQILSKGLCSENHDVEKEIIWLALEHSEQIFSRTKDCQTFHTVLDMVIKIGNVCSECCKLSLDWVSHHELALRNLLLRSPDEEIRRKFGKMIAGALKYLRDHDHYLYGVDVHAYDQGSSQLRDASRNSGALQAILLRLRDLLPTMYLHARAWDDYYGLVNDIAQFGRLECAMVHEYRFLTHCLEILVVDYANGSIKRLVREFPQHANYVRVLEKGRKFSFYNLLNLLATLLHAADLKSGVLVDHYEGQLHAPNRYYLSVLEDNLIRFGPDASRNKGLVFLDKAIGLDCNPLACQFIVRTLAGADPGLNLSGFIQQTILAGISIDPASGARPYLQAALAFCESCRSTNLARNLMASIAAEVEKIGTSGGDDHLEFFGKARRIYNEHVSRRDVNYFHSLVLKLVPRWAPTLLIYPDFTIRNETMELLHTLVFSLDLHNMDDEQQVEEIEQIGQSLCRACLRRINECVVLPNKQIEARQADEVTRVVNHCLRTYFREGDETERRQVSAHADVVLENLQTLTVSSPDDALSGEYDSEEVLTDFSNEFV